MPFRTGIAAGNGVGPDPAGNWCNPAGRALGALPRTGGAAGADASLWIKHPGTSDGDCGAYPRTSSGEFTAQIATDLIDHATNAAFVASSRG